MHIDSDFRRATYVSHMIFDHTKCNFAKFYGKITRIVRSLLQNDRDIRFAQYMFS